MWMLLVEEGNNCVVVEDYIGAQNLRCGHSLGLVFPTLSLRNDIECDLFQSPS